MRKWWYASAVVAGGIFLSGAAAPAQADLLPGTGTAEQQADEQLANLLGQGDGANVENPLRYSTLGTTPLGASPLMQFKSGQNTPDLNPVLPGGESAHGPDPDLPAADVVGGALRRPGQRLNGQRLNMQSPVQSLPLGGLLGGLPLFGGLLPNGGTPSLMQQPTMRQAETFDGGLPLLGGLGGLLPVNESPKAKPAGDAPDTSGLPAGGLAIVPAATPAISDRPTVDQPATGGPAVGQPATDQPAVDQPATGQPAVDQPAKPAAKPKPAPAVTPDDPRLHEEPDAGEAGAPRREFSADGRPVAGIDEQYR